jgi:hypothetical protein
MGISVPTTPGGGTTNVLQVARVVATTNQVRSGEHTIDGVATSAGNRVLLVGQSDAAENGLWVVVETPYTWTRPSDYATGATIQPNVVVPISEGTADGDTRWQITDDGEITVDTDPTTWGKTNLGLVAVVDDVNPALGGNLDLNNKSVTNGAITALTVDASANVTFNQNVTIEGAATMPATTSLPNTGDGAITTEASATDADGKPITIEAGSTTTGGTDDTGAGGDITLKPGAGKGSATGGDVIIQTAPADSGGGPTTINSYTTQMIVKESGNVGMGTTGPDRKLDILDSTGAADAAIPQLRLTHTDGTNYAEMGSTSAGHLFMQPSNAAGLNFIRGGSNSYIVIQEPSITGESAGDYPDNATGMQIGVQSKICYMWLRPKAGITGASIKIGVDNSTLIIDEAHNVQITRENTGSGDEGSLCYRPKTLEHSSGTLGLTMMQSAATVLLSGGDVELPNGTAGEINDKDLGTQYVVVNTTAADIVSAVTVAGADKFYDNSNTGGVTAAQQVDAMKAKTFILIGYDSGTTEAKWLVVG